MAANVNQHFSQDKQKILFILPTFSIVETFFVGRFFAATLKQRKHQQTKNTKTTLY